MIVDVKNDQWHCLDQLADAQIRQVDHGGEQHPSKIDHDGRRRSSRESEDQVLTRLVTYWPGRRGGAYFGVVTEEGTVTASEEFAEHSMGVLDQTKRAAWVSGLVIDLR
jgi:hypothetical protein